MITKTHRTDRIRISWIAAIGVILMAVFVQTYQPYVTDRPLESVAVPHTPTADLTWEHWLSGEYQEKYEAWVNTHIGFRSTMVRVANQIHYGVFRQGVYTKAGTKVLVGKEHWLYEGASVRAYQWPGWRTDEELETAVSKLAKLQQLMLEKRNIPVALVIAPSKPEIYPEYMDPTDQKKRMNVKESVFTDYQRVVPLFKAKNVLVSDGHAILQRLKKETEHPFFPKSGMHWNDYAAFLVLKDLRKQINPMLQKPFPLPEITGFETRPPEREDTDLVKLMNIYTTNAMLTNEMYPLVKPPDVEMDQRPRVLIIGDSFSYQLAYALKQYGMCHEVLIYDYFQTLRSYAGEIIKSKAEISLEELFSSYNLILIENVENLIPEFGFGFVDEAIAYLERATHQQPALQSS